MFSVQVSWLPTLCSCSEHLLKPKVKKKKKKLKKKAALNLGNASKSWSSGNMADWMGSLENMKCSITARRWGVTSEEPVSVKSVWKRKERKLHTIFLMLLRLKLPALLCFCTWLADPWRVRPLLQCPVVGESSTFSLSIPGEKGSSQLPPSPLALSSRTESHNLEMRYNLVYCFCIHFNSQLLECLQRSWGLPTSHFVQQNLLP